MKNKKEMIKLPIHFDLVNEIIYKSIIVIFFGMAYLFGFNLLRFNFYSVFFGMITFLLIYFKRASYLLIEEGRLEIIYFNYYRSFEIEMDQIDQCVFYNESSLVEIKTKDQENIQLYLKDKNKEKLLDWMIKHCPHISPIYIEKH